MREKRPVRPGKRGHHGVGKHQADEQRHIVSGAGPLQTAIETMSQGLSMFDAAQQLVICNQAFLTLHGLSRDQVPPGTLYWDFLELAAQKGQVSLADPAARRREFGKIISDARPWRGEVELLNGQIFLFRHEPLADGGWMTIQEDVTEAKRTEAREAARRREITKQSMRFSAAVNNMTHGLSMFDADWRLVVCNEPYRQLYRMPKRLSKPGTPFLDIWRHRVSIGMVAADHVHFGAEEVRKLIAPNQATQNAATMASGRVVLIGHQPMEDGGWVSTHEDITEQYRSRELIEHLAHHDGLTGLCNRTAFLEAMAKVEDEAAADRLFAVMCIDLDRFKPVNDNFGHAAGDEVLKRAAERIRLTVGDIGVSARVGGDEFAVLIGPMANIATAEEAARAIIAAISRPMALGGPEVSIGASIGIAVAPSDGTSAEALMHSADLALYQSKAGARGSYSFFAPELDWKRRRRRAIEAGLRQALDTDGLLLNFQPMLSLQSNQVCCCEALLRWTSREHGIVTPAEFVAIAEESGLIRDIGRWALRRACRTAASWPGDLRVAVNVSPMQFSGFALVTEVEEALADSGLAPQRLELEITENLFLADNRHNLDILHALKQMGVRIALDDFGTGYSSLSYLRSFPFDKIKIDRSFIAGLSQTGPTLPIVKAIAEMSARLGMTTVAEGVETEEQLAMVKAQGCAEVQGYLFSPPLPERAIRALISRFAGGPATNRRRVG